MPERELPRPAGGPAAARSPALSAGALTAAVLVVVLGAVYGSTLLPGVGYHPDTARFQFVGKVLGTPHPPGYPLFVLANHAFVSLLPVGSVAWRANLLSAVFSLAAALVLLRLLAALGARREVALAAALAFGLTPTVWIHSVVAEVYTLNLLLLVAVLFFAVRWHRGGRPGDFRATTALWALSFGHHLTTVTLAPALAFLVWKTDRRILLRGRTLAWLGGCALLAVAPYGYVVWRTLDPETPYLESAAASFGHFVRLVTGARRHGDLFAFSPAVLLTERLPLFLRELWGQYGVLLAAAVAGALRLRPRAVRGFLLLGLAGSLGLALNYRIADISPYFIPSYLIVGLFVAVGLEELAARLPAWPRAVVAGALALVPASLGLLHWREADQSRNTATAAAVESVLEAMGRDALLLPRARQQARFFQAYLLGEGLEDERNLHVTWPREEVARYLRGGEARLDYQRRPAPAGLAVFVLGRAHRDALAAEGFATAPAGRGPTDLFRVAAP